MSDEPDACLTYEAGKIDHFDSLLLTATPDTPPFLISHLDRFGVTNQFSQLDRCSYDSVNQSAEPFNLMKRISSHQTLIYLT